MTTTTDPMGYADRAAQIRAVARDAHVALAARGDGEAVTAYARFPAGDRMAYIAAEAACMEVLSLFRQVRPGTVWGTDSGSVGGAEGLAGGFCRLTKSGVEKRLSRQFLGADPELTLATDAALDRAAAAGKRRDAVAAIAKHAYELRDALAELGGDDGDDHLAHVGGQMIDRAAELADALAGNGGCAAELLADLACLSRRIKALLAVAP